MNLRSSHREVAPFFQTTPSDFPLFVADSPGKLPSIADIQEGLGPWAIVLYSVSAVTTAVLGLQFALLVR